MEFSCSDKDSPPDSPEGESDCVFTAHSAEKSQPSCSTGTRAGQHLWRVWSPCPC